MVKMEESLAGKAVDTGMTDMENLPDMVVSDGKGRIYDVPGLKMTGMNGRSILLPGTDDLSPLPPGSDLFELPDRIPVGYDPVEEEYVELEEYGGKKVIAVAAFMAPAYAQTHRASFRTKPHAPVLPLYSYTAAGWRDGAFYTAGIRVDEDTRQDPETFNEEAVEAGAADLLRRHPGNRLAEHLVGNCVRRYRCPAARNLALGRFEAPLPTSPSCNARCVGCLSLQEENAAPCAQERINFVPGAGEIAELAVEHLENAPRSVVSFGQGCEGEPLMQFEVLKRSIELIRKKTGKGTVNLNTNAGGPEEISELFDAGLDSIRVSVNSFREEYYNRYFRPVSYKFGDVIESMTRASAKGRWCSVNYFMFAGFTDSEAELEAFCSVMERTGADFIQMRNLNIDPDVYFEVLGEEAFDSPGIGIREWKAAVAERFPSLGFGCFNPPREDWPDRA
ncbi:MAG: radical SAM protein [Kiritimatiellia bacterium]